VRLVEIQRVLLRHGLDDYVRRHSSIPAAALPGFFLFARGVVFERRRAGEPRRAPEARAGRELGPIFVKFGQAVSTRRDLLPVDIAG